MTATRRQFLGSCLAVGGLAVSGCVSGDNNEDSGDDSADTPSDRPPGELVLSSSFPMEIYDPSTDERLSQIHWHDSDDLSHWHEAPLEVPLDRWESYEVRAMDDNGDVIPFGENEPFQLVMVRTEGTPANLVEKVVSGNRVDMRGQNRGDGNYAFRIVSGDEIKWTSPALRIRVS